MHTLKCFVLVSLLAALLCGCSPVAPPSVEPAVTSVAVTPPPAGIPDLERYAFPAAIDPSQRYLFYLHGKIIEDQGLPAVSPVYGAYEYPAILEKLASYGLVVISEQRPRDADGIAYAQKYAGQITRLLEAGVPPERITVVGASKGAAIAAEVSDLLKNPQLNYVLLASCHPDVVRDWLRRGLALSGNVLAISDAADTEYSGSCQAIFDRSAGQGLARHAEIVLQVGSGHGIVYQPLDEWLLPAVQWAQQDFPE